MATARPPGLQDAAAPPLIARVDGHPPTDLRASVAPDPSSVRGRATQEENGPLIYLLIFAGDKQRAVRVAASIRARDPHAIIIEVDILNDLNAQDVLDPVVALKLLMMLVDAKVDVMLIACDCASFSVAAGGDEQDARFQLRSKEECWGIEPVPADWKWYLIKKNALVNFTSDAIELSEGSDVAWLNEHPPDYGDPDTDYYWEKFKNWASIYDTPRFSYMRYRAAKQTFDQGAKGAQWRGKTTLWGCRDAGPELKAEFAHAQCSPYGAHEIVARGRNEYGESNSRLKAAYSEGTCDSLAIVLQAAARRARARRNQRALDTKHFGTITHVHDGAPLGSSPHTSAAPSGSSALFVDLNDTSCPLAELLPVSSDPLLEHAHTLVSWRIATALVLHGHASLHGVASAQGAGFRLGPGNHIQELTLSDYTDSYGKKRLAKAVKLATAMAAGQHVTIRNLVGASAERMRALPWMLEQLARQRSGTRIHLGSSKPHADAHEAALHNHTVRFTPTGSLRQLEPELDSVLLIEPFPVTNQCPVTEPDLPLRRIDNPPGPFTTAQLIPRKCVQEVIAHGELIGSLLDRAERGVSGHRASLSQRPARLHYTEEQALNPCGRGYDWIQRPMSDIWDVLQPSTIAHPPKEVVDQHIGRRALRFNGKAHAADAAKHGMPDKQFTGWGLTGFPGHPGPKLREAVVWYPHAGAFKHAKAFRDCAEKDVQKGFVTKGTKFPKVWPQVIDPFNVVMRYDKARLTIDKSLEQGREPYPIKAYNSHVEEARAEEARRGVRVKMIKVSDFTRALAIMLVSGAEVDEAKYDLQCYFRVHDRQIAHATQSGGIVSSGYRTDWCTNFGEGDAMDHMGRGTNSQRFMITIEFSRLDAEYPTHDPRIIAWRDARLRAWTDAGATAEKKGSYLALAVIMFFVDDGGLACFGDPLYDSKGQPVLEISHGYHGEVIRGHQRRSTMYFQAAMAISRRYGQGTPEDKQVLPGQIMVFLGIGCDNGRRRRLLSRDKRKLYTADAEECLGGTSLPNGCIRVQPDLCGSLVHKLLHAAEVIPLGRQHLYHCRQCLKHPNDLDNGDVILSKPAIAELNWWIHQMAKSEELGLPYASRSEFPASSSPDHVMEYHDASREVGNIVTSGFGAWTVRKDTLQQDGRTQDTFFYIVGRWTHAELVKHSINVLESHVKNMSTFTFVDKFRELGDPATHATSFSDNTTAESNAEHGRPGTALLTAMLQERQERCVSMGLHVANARVASIDNDIADLLSRGDIYDALRFARTAGLAVQELAVDPELRRIERSS